MRASIADMPVGVLMAVYRHDDAARFATALHSVISQNLPIGAFIRIYLGVDGPLTPPLEAVIEAHQSNLFLVSRSETNVGLAATLNRLIALRADEVFLFRMDSDDLCLPSRFERQLEYLNKHADVDILGTAITEHLVDSGTRRVVHFAAGPEDARRGIAMRVPVAHPTVCFRSSVFDRVGGYPLVAGNEDVAMWFKCLHAGLRFDNLAEPLVEFTVSENFWKRRSFKKAWSELRCYVGGLIALEGWSWRLAYPFARFIFRLAPSPVVQRLYSSTRLRGLPPE